jgi:hypothetical protein
MSKFKEFRPCESSWNLDRWAPRAYASWTQNVRRQEGESEKHSRTKRKRSTSPNPDMLNVDDLYGAAPEIVKIPVVPPPPPSVNAPVTTPVPSVVGHNSPVRL